MKTLKAGKTSGIQVTSLLELKQFMTPLLMPPSISALTAATSGVVQAVGSSTTAGMRMVHIPLPLVYDTEGACLTGPAQIGWMGQLVNMPLKFVLHADGKHKLHHGGWLLLTLGTHFLRWDTHNLTLSTRFAPLMYLFCKQQETLGAAKMLIDAAQTTCMHYFGKTLEPGAMMSDRSESFRAAFNAAYGVSGTFGQCWPHITRKFAQGEYAKKTWAHFEEAQAHIQTIHMAGSPPMKEMLIREVGLVWDKWGGKHMNTFWNSYCVSPWDCWSVGDFACMLCTPSQNTQESWHLHLQTTPACRPSSARARSTSSRRAYPSSSSSMASASPRSSTSACLASPRARCRRRSGTWSTRPRTSSSRRRKPNSSSTILPS